MSSTHAGPRKRPSKSLRAQPKQEGPVDDSAWIHRDKLAAIEIQEMEEAGMHVRQPHRSDSNGQNGGNTRSSSRSMSRSGLRRAQSKDLLGENGGDEPFGTDHHEEYERKRVSTIPAAAEEEYYEQGFDPRVHSELRTAEEVAAEHHGYKQHAVRPSTSRIPISKISPAPVPSEVVERDSPLPRSRSGSNAFPSTWDDLKRMRSGSAGSGILLDDTDTSHLRSSPDREPLSQSPSKATTRKGGARSTPEQQPNSNSATSKRPTTSHKRPEGEAPWIATMYKPDPRLPPDQQMLPTQAKRIAEAQWAGDEKSAQTQHSDFRLLDDENSNNHAVEAGTQSQSNSLANVQPPAIYEKENIAPGDKIAVFKEWPLTPAGGNRSSNVSPRPEMNNDDSRANPTVVTSTPPPPPPHSPSNELTGPVELPATERQPPTRLPDYDEKDEISPKKGCCCVMM